MYREIIGEINNIQYRDIIKIVLSGSKQNIQKVIIRPVLIKDCKKFQIEKLIGNQAFHQNIEQTDLIKSIDDLLNEYQFGQINVITNGKTISYRVSKKKKILRSEQKTPLVEQIENAHNKTKKYILEEGMPILPLVDLGVFDNEFRVNKSKYDKFKQINRFVELIDDELGDYSDGELRIVDYGCGKSYLTFILYYYFTQIKNINVHITGYDLKEDVVSFCNSVVKKYDYKNIEFITGDISKIGEYQGRLDAVITLHACDTATDYALVNAIKKKARYIFSVPCCQHEVNSQIKNDGELSVLLTHGLYKERFSAILTDAIRCEVLKDMGYRVDVIEFVDFENTPKNSMIRARLVSENAVFKMNENIEKLIGHFNISPAIIKLLS